MKIIDCEQGEPAWFEARLGVPTASCFDKILTPTGKPSTQAASYMHDLLAELVRGVTEDTHTSEWMQRGTELEPEARAAYEFESGSDVQQVGFVMAEGYGCSPDGMVGDDGLLEIKCPKPGTHIGYLLGGKVPTGYWPQVQGQLWVCERDWCDFMSYAPGMTPMVIRVGRDEDYIGALADRMDWFLETMQAKREQLEAEGHMQEKAA